jgi:YrbI family 3-deoxy-D-manno-octulosonate 8-phosphate phosphatase
MGTKKQIENPMIKLFLTDVDGVLTDATYLILPNGEKANVFNTRDWHGMAKLNRAGCRIGIISGDESNAVRHQAHRVAGYAGLFQGVANKLQFVADNYIVPNGEFEWDEVAFVGDDTNDLKLLEAVGLPACPSNAVDEVRELVQKIPDGLILYHEGGKGCVREFVDLIRSTHLV